MTSFLTTFLVIRGTAFYVDDPSGVLMAAPAQKGDDPKGCIEILTDDAIEATELAFDVLDLKSFEEAHGGVTLEQISEILFEGCC